MGVHATVSTTVCKALVSIARVRLCMCHLSCHRQFTRLGTRVAICPTSMGCTEGRFAQFWHAWLPLMLHKCLQTLHKQWDLHSGEGGMEIGTWRGGVKEARVHKSILSLPLLNILSGRQAYNSAASLLLHVRNKIQNKKHTLKATQMQRPLKMWFHTFETGLCNWRKFSQLQLFWLKSTFSAS